MAQFIEAAKADLYCFGRELARENIATGQSQRGQHVSEQDLSCRIGHGGLLRFGDIFVHTCLAQGETTIINNLP